jgi:hypothetical protein
MCSGDRERLSMSLVTEDAESTAHVKVGRNNQNPTAFHLSHAPGRVEGFVAGREPENGAERRRLRLKTILHIPGLTPDRHWAGQRRQGYIFSPANDALFFGVLQHCSRKAPAAAISPAETCDDARTTSSPLPKLLKNMRCLSDFNLTSSCVY